MKKLILTAALAVACVSAFGQGAFLFNNFGGGANAPVFDTDNVTKLGNTFEADLYWGPAGTTTSGTLTALGAPATFSGSGFFLGGQRTIPGVASGTIVGQIRVWDIASGSTWLAASTVNGAKVGESALFNIALAQLPAVPTAMLNATSFHVNLVGVPEPSSLALAGLGLAGLLVLRRRK